MRPPRPTEPHRAIVRDAGAGDLPALAKMGAALARQHHALDPERFFVPEEPIEDGYAWWLGKELGNPNAIVLAAESRGRIVGYAYGRVEPRDWNSLRARCGVGVDLWVAPRMRRAGVGRLLVEALLSRFAAKKLPRVVLHVAARNDRARAVFEGLGFRETLMEMARELPPPAPGRRRARPARTRRGS